MIRAGKHTCNTATRMTWNAVCLPPWHDEVERCLPALAGTTPSPEPTAKDFLIFPLRREGKICSQGVSRKGPDDDACSAPAYSVASARGHGRMTVMSR